MKKTRKITSFVLILLLIGAWAYNYPPIPFLKNFGGQGWPRIGNFPPKIPQAQAAVTTNNPTANTGSWTNPTNAYADGTNAATITSGSPSATHTYGTYGFSLAGGSISQVRVRYDASSSYGAITFRAAGTMQESNGAAVTVGLPAGLAANDIVILTASTIAGGSITLTTAGSISWTAITGSPVNVTGGEKLYVWWGRYASGSTGPTLTPGSDHIIAQTAAWYGALTSGSPIDVQNTGTETTSDTSFSFATGISSTVNGAMGMVICTSGADDNTAQFSNAFANTSLTSINTRLNSNTNKGGGGGFGLAEGLKATAGTLGTWTETLANASPKAYLAFALKPDPANEEIRVDVSWDGGTNWSSKQATATTASEATYWYDVTSATTWTPTKLNDTNFKVRVDANTVNYASTVSLDWIPVEVTYTAVTLPTVTTQAASSVEATTATGNGNITGTGGENNDKRGFVYGKSSQSLPGNVSPPATYTSYAEDSAGGYGTGAFTKALSGLDPGTTYYIRAYSHNSAGYTYGANPEISFLTKPAAPTSVNASDNLSDKVTITWAKSTGATGYRVYRDGADISGLLGDVATYDDSTAAAPTITAGSSVATDGTFADKVALSLSGTAFNEGTSYTYKVVAINATGNSADSATDTGYRKIGTSTYQWQRSAADSNGSYSDIGGATTAAYDDTGAPADGSGRYYRCNLSATGASPQTSAVDRGFKQIISITLEPGSGTVTYGVVSASKSTAGVTNQTQTVRNTGNVAEDFDIRGQNSAHWTLSAAGPGNAIYKHEWCTATCDTTPVWHAFTTSYAGSYLATNVAANGTQDFDLQITVPNLNPGTSQESVDVFIQATQH